jgi:hypothetical protein
MRVGMGGLTLADLLRGGRVDLVRVLEVELGDHLAIVRGGDVATEAVKVRAFDGFSAIEAEYVLTHLFALATRQGNVGLNGISLDESDAQHEQGQPYVGDGHADLAGRHRQAQAGEREERADGPATQDEASTAEIARHETGGSEDTAPHHVRDHQRRGAEEADLAQ